MTGKGRRIVGCLSLNGELGWLAVHFVCGKLQMGVDNDGPWRHRQHGKTQAHPLVDDTGCTAAIKSQIQIDTVQKDGGLCVFLCIILPIGNPEVKRRDIATPSYRYGEISAAHTFAIIGV